jgi:hypothetical protein
MVIIISNNYRSAGGKWPRLVAAVREFASLPPFTGTHVHLVRGSAWEERECLAAGKQPWGPVGEFRLGKPTASGAHEVQLAHRQDLGSERNPESAGLLDVRVFGVGPLAEGAARVCGTDQQAPS